MNARQAARLCGRLTARYPGSAVHVTADSDGARIFVEHADGSRVGVTTGDKPGVVLRVMLGADLRAVDDAAPEGVA